MIYLIFTNIHIVAVTKYAASAKSIRCRCLSNELCVVKTDNEGQHVMLLPGTKVIFISVTMEIFISKIVNCSFHPENPSSFLPYMFPVISLDQ